MLTYLPDLQWCHVAPLERRGVFGANDKSPGGHVAEGRDRWMLVSEEEGGEIDVGAGRCHVMEFVEMKETKARAARRRRGEGEEGRGEAGRGRRVGWRGVEGRDLESSCRSHTRPPLPR